MKRDVIVRVFLPFMAAAACAALAGCNGSGGTTAQDDKMKSAFQNPSANSNNLTPDMKQRMDEYMKNRGKQAASSGASGAQSGAPSPK